MEETYEAGLALAGTEVKSLRLGKCSIKEAFVQEQKGEMYVCGMHISPYEKGNLFNKDPLRVRKLLLHKAEINKLAAKCKEKGYTIIRCRCISRTAGRRWNRAVPRQEAVRQAGGHREEGSAPRGRAGVQGKKFVLKKRRWSAL